MDLSDLIINFPWQLRIDFLVPGGAATAAAFSLNEWTVAHGSQTHRLWVKHKLTSVPMEEKEGLAQKDSRGGGGCDFSLLGGGNKACWWYRRAGGWSLSGSFMISKLGPSLPISEAQREPGFYTQNKSKSFNWQMRQEYTMEEGEQLLQQVVLEKLDSHM